MSRSLGSMLSCVAALWAVSSAMGAILSTSGAMVEIPPPASVVGGALESSTSIFIFDEGTSVVPPSPTLLYNVPAAPGTYGDVGPPYFALPPGAALNSYLVHFDPIGGGFATLTGGVTFDPDEVVVAIQNHTPWIFGADAFFGLGTVTYPTAGSDDFRGFETLPGTDTLTIAGDLNTVSFSLFAELGVDEARIFTVMIPEPGATALLAVIGGALAAPRRRRS